MKNLMLIGLLLSAAILTAGFRQGAPGERAEKGRRTYEVYCASCHGQAGRGDGPVAGDLKVTPADLTLLSKTNSGRFPQERVYQSIDGRLKTRGHGSSEMPVWGATFQVSGSDHNQEREVRERILDLLGYLESIQRQKQK